VFFGLFKILKLKGNFEKVFIYAPSPITVGILGIVAAKKFKCKSYLWVHDLWPESIRVAGGIKSSFVLGLVNLMTELIYSFTDLLLVQSPEFKNYILNQGVAESKIIYYPYYAEDFYKIVEKDKSYLSHFPKGFNLLFAGNIGVAQSFDTIVNAFEKLKEHDINLVILGDGRDKSRIQEQINEKGLTEKFHFLGSFPPDQMPHYFTCADGLLITLKKADVFSYTIPGKLQSYLACGKPIIGALDGIGNKIISQSNSGFASDAENHELLANNILKLYKLSKTEKEKLSNNALDFFDKNFNKQNLLERLEEILN
jgi:glycosyltransferase involved in cell wall biosynthesis